jgi:hypothetical protein
VGELAKEQSYAFYGRSGSGKTTLAASFPKPILFLDINDKGTDSIADIKDVHVWEITKAEDIEDVYYFLRTDKHEFRTIVFDTVTEWQRMVITDVTSKKPGAPMSYKEWGLVSGEMNKWIVDFRNLPLNVVFVAQERLSSDDEDSSDQQLVPSVGCALIPSVANTLNAAVRVIGNTFIRSEKVTVKGRDGRPVKRVRTQYCLRVGPNPIYVTKIRKPKALVAPDFIIDPTYPKLINIIKGLDNAK